MDCSNPPSALDADPDIIGPGVLSAYFATAAVSLSMVIFGYLSGCLDESLLLELDRKIIHSIRRRWKYLRRQHPHLSMTLPEEDQSLLDAKRYAVTHFILTLSDQQLVTGMAILVAGVSDPKHISGFELSVVLALAWFSSTTHLATLTALRAYMRARGHGYIRHFRVGTMIMVMLLLMYLLMIMPWCLGSALPVQCMHEGSLASPAKNIAFVGLVPSALVLLAVCASYWIRIQDIYLKEGHPALLPVVLIWKLRHSDSGGLSNRDRFAENLAARRLSRLLIISKASGLKRLILITLFQYFDSFLSTLPSLAFSFSYGVSQVIVSRWVLSPNLAPDSQRIGFGQLIPLFLLALPFLASSEAYYDYRKRSLELKRIPANDQTISPSRTIDAKITPSIITPSISLTASQTSATASSQYDARVAYVRRYLRREIRIRIREGPGHDPDEMAQRKAALFEQYEQIARSVREMSSTGALVLFAFNFAMSTLLGITLKSGLDPTPITVGISVFVILRLIDIVVWAVDIYQLV